MRTVSYRCNILVHDYLDVDLNIVTTILDERLDDFREFGRHVEEYMQRLH